MTEKKPTKYDMIETNQRVIRGQLRELQEQVRAIKSITNDTRITASSLQEQMLDATNPEPRISVWMFVHGLIGAGMLGFLAGIVAV